MTRKQRIELRLSKVRSRLNEIAGLKPDEVTAEIREDTDRLTGEYETLKTQHRSAIISEGEEGQAAVGLFPDGADSDGAEVRSLLRRVTLGDYLTPASAGVGLAGAAAELNAALGVPVVGPGGGVAIPWRMLLTDNGTPEQRSEDRAFTTTTQYAGPIAQRPILQRLFGMDIMAALGVRIDSVPSGRTEWPLITGGVAPVQKAEGTAADDAVAVTFSKEMLKPKRLTGKYEYTHEMAAQVADLEQALRRDMADAVRAKTNDLIIKGDEATNAQEPDGFATTLTAPSNAGATATYADYAGIHASMETEVRSVIGVDVYKHAATVYESGSEALRRRSAKCMASPFVGLAANTGQHKLNIYHAAGPNGGAMRGDSVAAMWPVLEVIQDIYSKASQGVVLTWVALWDAQTAFRSSAYKRVAFKIT